MATKEQHYKKAQHNEQFFGQFDVKTTPYLDWVITGIFYSALHYMRALGSQHGFSNISSYGEMDNLFNRLSVLKKNSDVYISYRQLKDDSREARYEMRRFSPDEVQESRDIDLLKIKSFVTPLLSISSIQP